MIIETIKAIGDIIKAAKCKPCCRVFIQTGVFADASGIEYINGFYADIVSRNVLAGSATVRKTDGSSEIVPGHQIIMSSVTAPR